MTPYSLSYPELLFLLFAGHALADFALQSEWVAINKEPLSYKPGTPKIWPYLLTAHSLHHGLVVFLITQKLSLGLAETALHWCTDFGKGKRIYGFHFDQAIHIATKFVWLGLLMYGLV